MAQVNSFLQSPFATLIAQQEEAKPLPGAEQVKAQPLPDLSADPVPAQTGTPATPSAAAPSTDNLLPPDQLRPLFEATAAHFKVPVNVLMAIAHQESRYRPDAVNPASGAAGIGGYMDATAKSMGINPRDPNEAIPAAAQQIRERLDKGMSMEDAVKEHFAGPDRKKWGDKTAAYGQEVLAKAGAIGQELYGDAADASTEPAKAGTPAPDQDTQQNQFSPTRMGKADYEAEFRKLNPRASDAAVKAAMAQYDQQAAAKTKAVGNRVQDKFKALQSPEAMFDARLNAKLQGAPDGVAPQLPAREQPQAFPGTTTAHRPGVIDQAKGDFGRGIDNLKALGYGVGGLAAHASGYDARADDLLNHYVAIQNDIAKNNPATIGTYKNVHGLGDAGRYAIEAVMENLPMILPSLVTGGAGAKLAQAGAQRVVGGMIEAQVAKGIAREVAEKNAAQFIAKRIMLGSAAGAAPATIGMESGSIMGDIYQDTGKKASGTAIAFGIPAGLLDTLEPVMALRKIAGPAVDEVAGGIIKRLGVEAGKQFITEAGTEGLQTVLEEAAKARAANKNLMTPALLDNVIDSMLKGGIGGAGMGMASQGVAEAKGAIDTPERQIARAIQQNADGIQFAQPAGQVALQQLDPNGGAAIDPRDTVRPPAPAPAAPAGPLSAAIEAAAPPAFQADDNGFMGQILGDDGQVHAIDSRTGVTMTEAPTAPAGPLEAAIKGAAEQHAANPAPLPELPSAPPQPPALDTLPLEDLRAQLKQVAAAVKANPEQRQELTKQRAAIEKEIGARAKQAKADSKPAEEPLTTGPFEDMAAANRMMLRYAEQTGQPHQVVGSEGKFEVKPIGEQGDGINPAGAARGPDGHGRSGQPADAVGRADGTGSGAAGRGADGSRGSGGSRPVAGKLPDAGTDRTGADGAADAQPALKGARDAVSKTGKDGAHGAAGVPDAQPGAAVAAGKQGADVAVPAVDAKAAAPALTEPAPYHKVNPFHAYAFPDEARANAFMDKKSVDREQFEAVQTGPVRWQVKPRAAPVQDSFAKEVTADVPESPQVPEEATAARGAESAQPVDAIAGKKINDEWTAFAKHSGTLNIDRAAMPQVKAEHRGALVNFLAARGIEHQQEEIPASSLKPTQREFSPAKVEKARAHEGGDRSILVSSDGHVLDGHHQWLAKLDDNAPVSVIRLDAPISELLDQVKEFPSAEVADGATKAKAEQPQPAAVTSLAPTQAATYSLPEDIGKDWRGSAREDFKPTPRQQLVMDAAARAKDAGLFYTNEVQKFVEKELNISDELRARKEHGTEGGDVGYDIYHAAKAVDEQRSHAKVREVEKELGLKVGDKLGTVIFNDGKVNTGATVEAIDGLEIKLRGKRGAYGVEMQTHPLSIKYAIERAHEKGKRKDNYEEFLAARAKPEEAPAKPKRKKAAPKVAEPAAEQDEGVRYSVSGDHSPTFYSALERTLPDMAKVAGKDGTIKPEQARAWLAARQKEGKFKADELQWVGVDDWLQAQPGRVAVADIQNFVRENGVQVDEVTKGDGNADAKYSQYVLPGGENYRELLLTIPDPNRAKFNEEKKALAQSAKQDGFDAIKTGEPWYGPNEWQITDRNGDGIGKSSGATADEALAAWAMLKQGKVKGADYTSSHWDESNIVAHVRFNDRVDADGKRVLFIEELQSDWGQDGLKKGFREQQERQLDELIARRDSLTDEAERSRVQAEINVLGGKAPGVAEGPFVGDTKAWLSLGIKRMIRYAAENGYDRVAFVNGEQSADRYDLSKQVDEIAYNKGSQFLRVLDKDGQTIFNGKKPESELADFLGKEAAEKIGAGGSFVVLQGDGLKMGGEGMKAFYDKIVPQTINEVLKKVGGGRAGIVHLDTPQESFAASNHYVGPEHSLDALKDALAVARKGGGNIMENPLTGKREHWAFNRSANEQDLRKLIGLMEAGAPFKEAVLHGDLASPGFAELMGGEYQLLPADQRKVDARQQTGFDITLELRAKALAGMPLFSVAHPMADDAPRAVSPMVQALADKGAIVLHQDASTLPVKGKAPAGVQALTTADGTIHVVANALGDNARGIILHEAFHAGTKALIGSATWDGLNTRLGALYRQGEKSSGAARVFWDAARARVETAKAKGAVGPGMEHEEFGAYAIEEYAKAPLTVRKWVDDLLGAVKAWALRRFGKQLGDVTPAQLSSLAKLALLDAQVARSADHQLTPAFSAEKKLSQQELEAMDIDDLDQMAFGVKDGDIITLSPDQINLQYDDVENAQHKFDTQGGMKWARSVDLSEPVEVEVHDDGKFYLADGHHRWFAAGKTKKKLQAKVTIKGSPVKKILKDQAEGKFSADSSKTIEVDGQRRPIENSRGQLIAPDMHKQMAFWRYFDGSKVVDAQGRPEVLYHGTNGDFSNFALEKAGSSIDSGFLGTGFYFTDRASLASTYANVGRGNAQNVMPVYLALKNPYMWGTKTGGVRSEVYGEKNGIPEELREAVFKRAGFTFKANAEPDFAKEKILSDALRAELVERGHDGVIATFKSGGAEYVAFHPEQVKSAVGNDGSFSGDTPDIRYSVAGAPQPRVLTPDEQGLLRGVQAGVQDGMNRVKQVQQRISAITGVKDLAGADYYGAETNRPGRIAARKEDGRDKLIEPMMRRLAKAGYTQEQLSELLHAQHAEERNEAVARINPEFPDGGSGMKTAEAHRIMARYQSEPALLALADEARQIARETLDMKRAYGLITQAQYDDLATAYDNYVPLKGDGEYGPKIKRAMGHGEREEHVVENIARDFEQAIVVGEKNLARQSLLQMVLQYPDDDLWTARVPPKGRYVAGTVFEISPVGTRNVEASFTSQSQVAAWLEGKGAAAAGYEVNTSGGERVTEFTKPLQDNEVMVYVKGSPVRVQVHDEVLARQLRPLHTEMMNTVLGVMQKHNRYLSTIYTGYNPAFILKNATRDAITGSINMTGNHGALTAAKAWAKYPAAWATMLKWAVTKEIPAGAMGDHLREYRAQGGKIGASYMSDLEEQGKSLQRMFDDAKGVSGYAADGKVGKAAWIASRKAIGGMAHAVEVLNQAFENSLRLALFAQLREQGAKPGQAAQAAKTVTVNFDRKGTATPYLGAFYLFINPAIQGTANVTTTLAKGQHKGQAWALAGMMAAAGFAAAIHGMDDDKDRWLGEKWDTRTKNLRIRVGSHTINVPLSQEYAPFYAVGVAMGEVRRGQSSLRAAANVLSSFLDSYYPMQGAIQPGSDNYGMDLLMAHVPTVGKMAAQIAANRNSFGNKVVPETDNTRNRPDNLKMYRGTKNSAYDASAQGIAAAGQALGADKYGNDLSKVSPETLKLVWATYTGGLGKFVADSAGLGAMLAQGPGQIEVGDWPVAKDFVKADKMLPLRTRYFDLSKDAQDAIDQFAQAKKMHDAAEMKAIATDPEKGPVLGLAKMVAAVNKIEAVYADMAVNINADKTLGPADKRARLKDLEDKQEVIYRKAIAAFKK